MARLKKIENTQQIDDHLNLHVNKQAFAVEMNKHLA
jgi:hypothetical protein